jgi:hypothetical protein
MLHWRAGPTAQTGRATLGKLPRVAVRNLDNFLIMLIQKLFDMMMTYTQIDNLNVTHSKHAYLNEL